MSRITSLPVATAVTLALSTGFAPASGGTTPIWQVPVTLDQPGAYYLSRNLAGSGGAALIVIAADDVTLDLAGHRIERTDAAGDVIGTLNNPSGVVVRDGTVVGGFHGVNLENIAGSGFGARVERVSVRGTAGDGIRVASGFEVLVPAHAVIRDNAVAEAGGRGIHVFALDSGRPVTTTRSDQHSAATLPLARSAASSWVRRQEPASSR